MTNEQIWNSEETVASLLDVIIPAWIDQDITAATIAAIYQGGCDSGAYMPAATYHRALVTMNAHGDAVLDYMREDGFGDLPPVPNGMSWDGIACFYVSTAVDLWASEMLSALECLDA